MLDSLTNSDGIPALERLMQFTGQRHRVILDNIANLSTPGFRPRDVSPQAFQAQLAQAIDAQRSGRVAGAVSMPAQQPRALGLGRTTVSSDAPVSWLASSPGSGSGLNVPGSRQIEVHPDRMILHPEPIGENILFHDGNDRNVERVMQSLVENFMAFRASAQLLRSRLSIISTAIRGHL